MHQHFANDPAMMESILLDSTIVRAHPCAAGASKKNGGQDSQALGRSRGGFSTKIHACVDALGNPLRFLLTGGRRPDISQAEDLIAEFDFEHEIAYRSYDAEEFLILISQQEADVVIPPRKNRKEQREYDRHLIKERHLIECLLTKSSITGISSLELKSWISACSGFSASLVLYSG